MNTRSKGRGRPGPDANKISNVVHELENALIAEDKYMTNQIVIDQISEEDALLIRDSTARKLRFLKLWFELPSHVFLTALNFLDRFLTRMKVKPAYLACASTSCFYMAAELHKCQVEPSELIARAQAKCKISDIERMSDIIRDKLGLIAGEPPVTAYTFLTLYLNVLEVAATQLSVRSQVVMLQKKNLLTRLEVVMLDSECARYRPSIVALALLQVEMERCMGTCISSKTACSLKMLQCLNIIYELQCIIRATGVKYQTCYSNVKSLLENYDNNVRNRKFRLRWRSSPRVNSLKPSINFRTNLKMIRE